MKFDVVACLLTILCSHAVSEQYRFDGHKVLHIAPRSLSELERVLALHHTHDVDVWRFPTKWNQTLDVYVSPEKMEAFMEELKLIDTNVKVWIHDLQRLIDEEKTSLARKSRHPKNSHGRIFDPNNYHRYNEIQSYLLQIESENLGGGVSAKREMIGITYEGREIDLIHISKGDVTNKKKIFIDGGIHAREWISPAFTLYVIDQLVHNINDPDVTLLLDNYDWYIVPVLNPDGYEYSHTNYRLWRKNRAVHRGSCRGTDLNRNFGHEWNPAIGGSTNPCNDVFSGDHAFSEPESQALQNFILANSVNMTAYITVHSYGQMWLYPWGYTSALPTDWQDLDNLAKAAVSALTQTHGTQYVIGSSTNVLYSAAGGSDDWAKGAAGVKYSYTLELRDTGAHGFMLPTDQIQATSEETWNALVAFCKALPK